MKKIFMMAVAAAALTFASCGQKQQAPVDPNAEAIDSVAVLTEEANTAADEVISQLGANLESKDVSAFQTALEAVKAKVADFLAKNPEIAKEYISKVQNFLKENADKVKALVGDNAAVAAAVSAITDIEPENVVNGFLQSVGETAEAAKDSVVGAVENAKDAAVDAAKEKANEAVDAAADKTKEALGL